MKTIALILKEIAHRKVNFLLVVLAIVTAGALFTSLRSTLEASQRETIRTMRDLGFNLRIIPRATDLNEFYLTGFSAHTMPQGYIEAMVEHEGLLYNHLLAVLHQKIEWQDRTVILTGISKEFAPPGKRKPPMIFTVEPGTIHLGYQIARLLDLEKGDQVDLFGRTFTVADCHSEKGTEDDVRVYGELTEVQALLGKAGEINEIKALECQCVGETVDQIDDLRAQLEGILPDAQVVKIQPIALPRQQQRRMTERYTNLVMPFVLVVCAAWIGVLAMLNVRQRRTEIGIMRALGYGGGRVAWLFLGKAVLAGLIGAGIGFAIGTWLALSYGPSLFPITAGKIVPDYDVLAGLLIAAPVFAALASLVPAMVAVKQDPAITLREE